MAVDLTLRLIKGTELTFAEIDNNWQLLNHAIDSSKSLIDSNYHDLQEDISELRQDFDSNLDSAVNKIILIHDSDTQKHLIEHDSDLAAGFARHDSEHAWNVQQHYQLESALDSEHLWNVSVGSEINSRLDSEHLWSITIYDSLQNDIDSVNTSLNGHISIINNNFDSIDGDLNQIQINIDSVYNDLIVNIDSISAELNIITEAGLQNIVEDSSPELGGDLVVGQNILTFADTSSVVSHIDFTKNIFGETNNFVVSSVQDISLFLDANGGGHHHFRIFSNENPDAGTVSSTDNIFQVDESGNTSAYAFFASDTLNVGDWSLAEVGGELVISKNGTKKVKIKDNGEIVSISDVTAFGTV